MKQKKEVILKMTNFDELLDADYGTISTKKRDEFEKRAQYFIISEVLKDAHEKKRT